MRWGTARWILKGGEKRQTEDWFILRIPVKRRVIKEWKCLKGILKR